MSAARFARRSVADATSEVLLLRPGVPVACVEASYLSRRRALLVERLRATGRMPPAAADYADGTEAEPR